MDYLHPIRPVSKSTGRIISVSVVSFLLLAWQLFAPGVLPKPTEIPGAIVKLFQEGLAEHLYVSLMLNMEALLLSTLISLGLAYLSVVPIAKPVVTIVSKFRFLSMAGLTVLFTMMAAGSHSLKIYMLVFGITGFFVTSMADVVNQTPQEKLDLAKTLRMSEWQIVWEVIILGRFDLAFDVIRQNAAIGWMMLTMVEGLAKSEGGVGTVLITSSKFWALDLVFAIQIIIGSLGWLQDLGLVHLKGIVCPYAQSAMEKR